MIQPSVVVSTVVTHLILSKTTRSEPHNELRKLRSITVYIHTGEKFGWKRTHLSSYLLDVTVKVISSVVAEDIVSVLRMDTNAIPIDAGVAQDAQIMNNRRATRPLSRRDRLRRMTSAGVMLDRFRRGEVSL